MNKNEVSRSLVGAKGGIVCKQASQFVCRVQRRGTEVHAFANRSDSKNDFVTMQ